MMKKGMKTMGSGIGRKIMKKKKYLLVQSRHTNGTQESKRF
jgi:hypothetical protein